MAAFASSDSCRLRAAAARTDELSGGGCCPLCGQELGDAFHAVQAHREQDVHEATTRADALQADVRRATKAATAAATRARTLAAELEALGGWASKQPAVWWNSEADAVH